MPNTLQSHDESQRISAIIKKYSKIGHRQAFRALDCRSKLYSRIIAKKSITDALAGRRQRQRGGGVTVSICFACLCVPRFSSYKERAVSPNPFFPFFPLQLVPRNEWPFFVDCVSSSSSISSQPLHACAQCYLWPIRTNIFHQYFYVFSSSN